MICYYTEKSNWLKCTWRHWGLDKNFLTRPLLVYKMYWKYITFFQPNHVHENIHLFNENTLEGEGSFFIPGAIVNVTVCDNHIYVMFCETSHTIEYCSAKIPVYADREGRNDCPFEVKPKEWLAKTNLQVARLSYKSHGKWDIINVLRGNTPSSPFNDKYKFYFSHFLILGLSNYTSNLRISFSWFFVVLLAQTT